MRRHHVSHQKSYSDTSALQRYDFGGGPTPNPTNLGLPGTNPALPPTATAAGTAADLDDLFPDDLLAMFGEEGAELGNMEARAHPAAPSEQYVGSGSPSSYQPSSSSQPSHSLPSSRPRRTSQLSMETQREEEPVSALLAPPPPPVGTRKPRKSAGVNAGTSRARSSTPDDAPSMSSRGRNNSSTSTLTPEEKRIKRIMANRESAHRSRMKKMNYVADLERQIAETTDNTKKVKQEIQRQMTQRGELVQTMHKRRDQATALKSQVTKQLAFQEVLLREREGLKIFVSHSLAKQRHLQQQLQQQQQLQLQQQLQQQQPSLAPQSSFLASLQQQQQHEQQQLLQAGAHRPRHSTSSVLDMGGSGTAPLLQPPPTTAAPPAPATNACTVVRHAVSQGGAASGSAGPGALGSTAGGGVGSRPWRAHNLSLPHTAVAAAAGGNSKADASHAAGALGAEMAAPMGPLLSAGGSDDLTRAAALLQGVPGSLLANGGGGGPGLMGQQQQGQGLALEAPNWGAPLLTRGPASGSETVPQSGLAMHTQLSLPQQQQPGHGNSQPQLPTASSLHRRNYTWDSSGSPHAPCTSAFATQQHQLLQQHFAGSGAAAFPNLPSTAALDVFPLPFSVGTSPALGMQAPAAAQPPARRATTTCTSTGQLHAGTGLAEPMDTTTPATAAGLGLPGQGGAPTAVPSTVLAGFGGVGLDGQLPRPGTGLEGGVGLLPPAEGVGGSISMSDIITPSGELNLEHLFSDDCQISLQGSLGSLGFDTPALQVQQGSWEASN